MLCNEQLLIIITHSCFILYFIFMSGEAWDLLIAGTCNHLKLILFTKTCLSRSWHNFNYSVLAGIWVNCVILG